MTDVCSQFQGYLTTNAIPQDLVAQAVEECVVVDQPPFAGFTVLNDDEFAKVQKNRRIVEKREIPDTGHKLVLLRTIRKDHKPLGTCPVVPLKTWIDQL